MMFEERMNEYRSRVDKALEKHFAARSVPHRRIWEAMAYSVMAGGKRIRPVLCMEFARVCGAGSSDALPAAAAVEMLHSYSLIHDDLPCMDDDDLRRGRPTSHKVFGEYTAVLAGDALQTEAFRTILNSGMEPAVKAECARILSEAAGADGMCAGQQLDMDWEGRELSESELELIDSGKTCAIIEAACLMGCAVGGADEEQKKAASEYARCIGLAFQIRDDMLDVLSTPAELGKTVGSDSEENKTTYMSLLGREECEKRIAQLNKRACEAVRGAFREPDFLCALADFLGGRKK